MAIRASTASAPTKGEQARQHIISAAYDLITRQGYAATSMRQIAEKAGLALGSIYNHFSSKEDVFRAMVGERHPFFQIVPLLIAVPGDTSEEFVRNAAHILVDELARRPEFLNLMLVEMVEFKARHAPAMYKKLYPTLLPVVQRIGSLQGGVRDIPPFVLTRAFLGMFFSYYITEALLGRAMPPELRQLNTIDYFVDIFLRGILPPEAK